jgi:hypothetical protein
VARSGYAIDCQTTRPVYIENLCLKGIGDKARTIRGIRLGQSGKPGPNGSRLRDVVVMNFAVGVEINDSYYGRYDCLSIYGCTTGLLMGNNQTLCTQLNISTCGIGVHLFGGQVNLFHGGAIQGCSETGFLIEKGEEHLIEGFYFENKNAKLALDVRSDINRIVWNHFGTKGDAVRISGNGNVVFSASKAIQAIEISGLDTTFLGPISAVLSDKGSRTVLLPPMGNFPSPPTRGPVTFPGGSLQELAGQLIWQPTAKSGKSTTLAKP